MNRSQSKYFNTARRMDGALVSLLAEKDLQFVTVKEICERAGVSRSTFYLHYGTIGDLLDECLDAVMERFLSYFENVRPAPTEAGSGRTPQDLVMTTPEFLVPYLTFVRENLPVFRAAVERPGAMGTEGNLARLLEHVVDPVLERFSIPERDRRYYALYHLSGINAVVSEWVGRGCADDVRHVADIISSCSLPREMRGE